MLTIINHNANEFAISDFRRPIMLVSIGRKCIFSVLVSFFMLIIAGGAFASVKKVNVLCTTFPIYQITRNVVQGSSGMNVELMLPSNLGCPHDYSLTPGDMQKIAKADVLVINGLGMEEFLGAPVKRASSRLLIIDSSAGIRNLLEYTEEDHDMKGYHEEKDHLHEGLNPHLFASPHMYGLLAVNIARGLSKADPKEAGIYGRNASEYKLKMDRLADEFTSLVKKLKNRNVVTQHGAFDYLARDTGLRIVAVLQSHPGMEPSASEMISIIGKIRKYRAGAIFYEPQFSSRTPEALSKETGIPAAILDPCATGPDNAGLDYYERVMRRNIVTIQRTLGSM
jgi:zinc transport system substrate-binding protein